ncbi:uncharacterized protein B0T15DRAFT_531128 [Chaetomium strumarium]|uniref:Uncharacterized protein n=1 Tax=Chaetomium strumarium TaxID=1170767 RepID=A0AAJ0GS19_9PEZI|nr:hypothetical protein B0T15DRAFT_531128 [Chaetomium strumarium]
MRTMLPSGLTMIFRGCTSWCLNPSLPQDSDLGFENLLEDAETAVYLPRRLRLDGREGKGEPDSWILEVSRRSSAPIIGGLAGWRPVGPIQAKGFWR